MPGVSRLGDINSAGGRILRGARTVFVNGRPAGLNVSPISPHMPWGKPHPPHAVSFTLTGSLRVFCESAPLLKIGSRTTCGHPIIQGSFNVFV
jgi:uncharacterized Zn-binding protein involved in type VI secretion